MEPSLWLKYIKWYGFLTNHIMIYVSWIVDLGCPSSDGALSGCEMSRHCHSPGWNQEGPAGARKTWSSGEILPRPASGSGADQSNVRWPLHFRHGKKMTPTKQFYLLSYKDNVTPRFVRREELYLPNGTSSLTPTLFLGNSNYWQCTASQLSYNVYK